MTALLGILAVAGYQNRDKLSEMIGNRTGGSGGLGGGMAGGTGAAAGGGIGGALSSLLGGGQGGQGGSSGLGGLLSSLTGGAGGASGVGRGGLLGGGLGEMSNRFRENGHADAVESWVGTGPNRDLAPHELEQAIGSDVLEDLMEHTGLPREELLARLSRELPKAVDQYTPGGRLPDDDDEYDTRV